MKKALEQRVVFTSDLEKALNYHKQSINDSMNLKILRMLIGVRAPNCLDQGFVGTKVLFDLKK